mmetsp:Transcript_8044/g.20667  ORF Transcript_8044/g.20667 Transcript_8044/m.20667 type:complete len:177 (+) Transcript_8044:189-719(+)
MPLRAWGGAIGSACSRPVVRARRAGVRRARVRPERDELRGQEQDVQGPAAADGSTCSPSGRVPPPALISELGEWHLSTLSDDERFLESELMVLNCLFHAAGHAIEAISNAVETYVRERPEGEGGIQQDIAAWYRLLTKGGDYVAALAGPASRSASPATTTFSTTSSTTCRTPSASA